MKLTVEQVRQIKERAIVATKASQAYADAAAKKEADRKAWEESKAGRATKLIDKFGLDSSARKAVYQLVALLTGMEMPEIVREDRKPDVFEDFAVLVSTKNENSHNYPLNVPLLMVKSIYGDGSGAVDIRGVAGNHLQWKESGLIIATDDQINEFFDMWEAMAKMGIDIGKDVNFFKGDPEESA